jgi:anti-anti-sigma factor
MTVNESNVMTLEGALDRDTVPGIRKNLLKRIKKEFGDSRELRVDLSGVSKVDSAGVALLVELLKAVSERGGKLKLTGLDENARKMIQLARLSELFGINNNSVSSRKGAPSHEQ